MTKRYLEFCRFKDDDDNIYVIGINNDYKFHTVYEPCERELWDVSDGVETRWRLEAIHCLHLAQKLAEMSEELLDRHMLELGIIDGDDNGDNDAA